ncbi:sodium:solute symporter family protein [Aureliella helgolandensis]|uniref:Sodium/pantothenate symporter n=1 Tax=Aureliella helgolandensis TaxID=2527968 RepID=A0A518G3I9_9BACT|nr:sodium:solute symporter family protein [Aureliella helgolandensis]QDV23109.1 Sodium/pantothenate symporter [Aureliella helgolandensis]
MLTFAVFVYLLFTIAIGLYASSKIHGAKDFMVAGRSLPLYMNFTTVFATWFGAETVLSVSANFAHEGLHVIPGDPFGFAACLILVGLFFARAFYRMNLLTIGDFYHQRYGKSVEVFTSVVITLSYVGWAAAQLTALGLVLSVLGQGAGYEWLTINRGILIGAVIVVFYTTVGGMWSVALTDMIQTLVIIVGLLIIAGLMANMAGGVGTVFEAARDSDRLRLFPNEGMASWLTFLAGFLTAALGSIPQQDVFQRVTSAKDEQTAVRGTLLGGSFYLLFAFVPMFIAYAAVVIEPEYLAKFSSEDIREIQRTLPHIVMNMTPFWAQAIFFGALLSAILSTSSGTLLAPSSLFVENVLRPFLPGMSDKRLLLLLRLMLLVFASGATYQAITSNKTMYEMVEYAYSVTLVGALIPLALGLYWKGATTQGAVGSIFCGICAWLYVMYQCPEFIVPPQLCGLAASLVGMLLGSLTPQLISTPAQPATASSSVST